MSSSSESSSDEEYMQLLENVVQHGAGFRAKNSNYVEDTVPMYSDEVFLEHFRVSREVFGDLVERFQMSIYFNETRSGGHGKLNSEYHILVFLWFAAHQTASFRDVADRFGITISSLFRIVRRVSNFLNDMAGEIIQWPNNIEKNEIEQFFREKGFPGVVGIIDGTHLKIDKPVEDPDSYLNRKHYFSIQAQVVCDHQRRIRDIFIGYPGSVHDSRVFRVSPLSEQLEEKCGQGRYILGDSGYPCTKHLLTPYKDNGHLTVVQTYFNTTLSRNRYLIEHCFGILKQKFRQLYHCKLRNIRDSCRFFKACCVLHSLAINNNFDYVLPDDVLEQPEDQQEVLDENDDRDGATVRNSVAELLYRENR